MGGRESCVGAACCIAVLLAAPLTAQSIAADTTGRIIYQDLRFGSQANFSPLTVLLNKGFDYFQSKNALRTFWDFPFHNAIKNGALDALARPRAAIERAPGWGRWLETEVLPLRFNFTDAAWAANYTEHLLGGGLTYRMLGEWYAVRRMPAPRLLAGLTTFSAAILNEAVEHPYSQHAASSSVADLYVFDLGGILLFNWDPLVRFFGGTLEMTDWSNQASFTLPNHQLENTGQYYIMKVPLPLHDTRLFLRGGMGVQIGLSRRVSREHSITFALGEDTEVRHVDPVTLHESIHMKLGGGIYVDRRNSLLASLSAGPAINRVTLNVYPGVLPGLARDVGVWTAYTRDYRVIAGMSYRRALGLGLGYGR